MCGRYTLRTKLTLLAQQFLFNVDDIAELTPRFNVSPGQQVPAVRLANGKRQLVMLRWGLVPSWSDDPKRTYKYARGETVATNGVFRAAYKRRRCLIPADGYYEWEEKDQVKLPWFYELEQGRPFGIAGLWESWKPEGAKTAMESCALVMTTPNRLTARLHDRMPVIVYEEDYTDWLSGNEIPLVPYEADRMTERPVSTYVNNSRHEGPACIAPREA
jgi:putative SOS response-associated peptidase YedK